MDNPKQQIVDRLKEANNILVTVSNNPSVDQLAACIGLTLALNKMKKHATAVFSGAVPSIIEFLEPEKTLEKTTDSLRDFIIAIDKAKADKLRYKVEDKFVKIFITPYRTSIGEKDLEFSEGDFNVDVVVALGVHKQADLDEAITAHGRILHDATVISINTQPNVELGSINLIDQQASSLSEIVVELIDHMDKEMMDGQIATALLTGVVAETDRFRNEKTSPLTMSISAVLLGAGANQQLVASKLDTPASPPPQQPIHQMEPTEKSSNEGDKQPQGRKTDDGMLEIDHDDSNAKKLAEDPVELAKPQPENAPMPPFPPMMGPMGPIPPINTGDNGPVQPTNNNNGPQNMPPGGSPFPPMMGPMGPIPPIGQQPPMPPLPPAPTPFSLPPSPMGPINDSPSVLPPLPPQGPGFGGPSQDNLNVPNLPSLPPISSPELSDPDLLGPPPPLMPKAGFNGFNPAPPMSPFSPPPPPKVDEPEPALPPKVEPPVVRTEGPHMMTQPPTFASQLSAGMMPQDQDGEDEEPSGGGLSLPQVETPKPLLGRQPSQSPKPMAPPPKEEKPFNLPPPPPPKNEPLPDSLMPAKEQGKPPVQGSNPLDDLFSPSNAAGSHLDYIEAPIPNAPPSLAVSPPPPPKVDEPEPINDQESPHPAQINIDENGQVQHLGDDGKVEEEPQLPNKDGKPGSKPEAEQQIEDIDNARKAIQDAFMGGAIEEHRPGQDGVEVALNAMPLGGPLHEEPSATDINSNVPPPGFSDDPHSGTPPPPSVPPPLVPPPHS
jgi:hypothetical protein